jgi:hypothetical protein
LVADDGTAAICARIEGPKRCGDAGWLHRLAEPVSPPPPTDQRPVRPKDWAVEAARYAANMNADRRQTLAASLGLPVEALAAVPLLGFRQDDPAGPCFTFPETDAGGNVVGLNRRFEGGKKRMLAGGKRGLTLPADWRDRPGPVFVVEGPTDAIAMTAAGLSAVGRPSNSGGLTLLAELLKNLDSGRPVVIVGENDQKDNGDWPGRNGAETTARALADQLNRPIRWALPPDGVKDVRSWLTAPDRCAASWPDRGGELLAHMTATAITIDPRGVTGTSGGSGGGPPRILIGPDEHRVNAEAAAAMAGEPDLYQRAGMLVQVVEAPADPGPVAVIRRPAGAPVVRDLPPPLLRERLTRCAYWVRAIQKGDEVIEVPAHPPPWCVQAVHVRGDWPAVRRLEALVPHPALLEDGSILSTAGFDTRSGLLVCTPPGLTVTVPDMPTRPEVVAALAGVLDVVSDFPFERPEHRAAWVASLLTPLAWFAFSGPAPLFLFDKNVRGAGAGLLADVVALVVTGRAFSRMTYTADREELRKKITSLAIEGERLVLLDNLAGGVGCDVLDAALTSDRWKDRLLGGNRVYDGPLHVCWYGTGNNVQLHADTARRVCHVRMETQDERPELRTGFKYPDLRAHVRASRGRLLSAALTILRGWFVAGRPRHGLTPWGSFEGWSGVVREAVVFAGLPDPGETRLALQKAADRDAVAMTALLLALEQMDPGRRGVTTAEIIDTLRPKDKTVKPEGNPAGPTPAWLADLRAAVEDLCGKLDGRALGYVFRRFARRNFGGRLLDKAGPDGNHANRWAVFPVGSGCGRPGPSPASPESPVPHPAGDAGHPGDDSARNETSPKPRRRFRSNDRLPESRV